MLAGVFLWMQIIYNVCMSLKIILKKTKEMKKKIRTGFNSITTSAKCSIFRFVFIYISLSKLKAFDLFFFISSERHSKFHFKIISDNAVKCNTMNSSKTWFLVQGEINQLLPMNSGAIHYLYIQNTEEEKKRMKK